ncbi:MAG: hypothetical protein HYZ86_02965, partial [Candidatus Omnitrophica bacterium]|nr:hypothetical protein [Candidatus Omnitrophota bacterium]
APFSAGEVITYDIKQMGFKVGRATLTFPGEVLYEGQRLFLIVFRADGFNFYDQEEIYLDPDTFLPVVVLRDLNIFGAKEKIREDYLQGAKKIYLHKFAWGKETEQVIAVESAVDNIYGFIYRYRRSGSFRTGEDMDIVLPTQKLKIGIVGPQRIKAAGRKAASLYMESKPDKYKVWFSIDSRHIPFRIGGTVGIANTVMMITNYVDTHRNPN